MRPASQATWEHKTPESNKSVMGLNLSNEQIAHELALHSSDGQQMTTQLRDGIVKKSPR